MSIQTEETTGTEDQGWHRGDWMQTFTGRQFYPLSPRPEDIDPRDIAHALGMLCRYNGHVDRFYSVAEHCVLMSMVMPTPQLALEALLHDGTEAYVGDMIRPLKHTPEMEAYRDAEDRVMLEIAKRFGLPTAVVTIDDRTPDMGGGVKQTYLMPPEVKDADTRILLTERNALMSVAPPARWGQDGMEPLAVTIHGWDPDEAERMYLERLVQLGVQLGPEQSLSERTRP